MELNDEKLNTFILKKILEEYKNGEGIQDDWDLHAYIAGWTKEYNELNKE